MKKAIMTVAVATMLVLTGCTGGQSGESTTPEPTAGSEPVDNVTELRVAAADVAAQTDSYRAVSTSKTRVTFESEGTEAGGPTWTNGTYRVDRSVPISAYGLESRNYTQYGSSESRYVYGADAAGVFDDGWVQLDRNSTDAYRVYDPLHDIETMLGNTSTVEMSQPAGNETVKLEASVDHMAYNATVPGKITDAALTVWVDPSSDRIQRAKTVMNRSIRSARYAGQATVTTHLHFTYTDVDVSLPLDPDEAEMYEPQSGDDSDPPERLSLSEASERLPVDTQKIFWRVENMTGADVEAPTMEIVRKDPGQHFLSNPFEGRPPLQVFGFEFWDEPMYGAVAGRAGGGEVTLYLRPTTDLDNPDVSADIENTLAHEFVHIVQPALKPEGMRASMTLDGARASRVLTEGGATYVERQYTQRYLNVTSERRMEQVFQNATPGMRHAGSRYYYGVKYIASQANDSSDLASIYENAPTTTEAILHNQSDDDPQPPLTVTVDTGPEWEPRDEPIMWNETRGELLVRNVLGIELSQSQAAAGADGWGTDRLFTVSRVDSDSTYGVAWALRWENDREATEFEDAFEQYAAQRSNAENEYRLIRVDAETTVVFAGAPSFVSNMTATGTNATVAVTSEATG